MLLKDKKVKKRRKKGEMTMKRRKISVILAALLSCSLAACGSSVGVDRTQNTGSSSSTSSAASAAASADTSETASSETVSSTAASAAASSSGESSDDESSDGLIKITFQSKWIPQAQFMGYYTALDKGYYKDEGLDVTINPGGSDINVPSVVESGSAQIGTTNLYNVLSYQEQGYPLVAISQIMQDSPFVLVCHKDSVSSVADLKGKTIGIWTGGNDAPVRALLNKNGIDPDMDCTLASQGTTIDGFLDGSFDANSAMTYNELLLAYENGYTDDDLYLINMEDEGCGMLADCVFVNSDWLADNHDTAVKFMRATIKGWQYACANLDEATDIVYNHMDKSSADKDFQRQSAEKVAAVVCPDGFDSAQIGSIPEDKVANTIDIAKNYGIITQDTDLNKVYDTSIMDEISGSAQ